MTENSLTQFCIEQYYKCKSDIFKLKSEVTFKIILAGQLYSTKLLHR